MGVTRKVCLGVPAIAIRCNGCGLEYTVVYKEAVPQINYCPHCSNPATIEYVTYYPTSLSVGIDSRLGSDDAQNPTDERAILLQQIGMRVVAQAVDEFLNKRSGE